MKRFNILVALCFLFGCISEYTPRGIEEVGGILVVDGFITDYESVITLSRSRRLTDYDWWSVNYIFDARVYVERDDGALFPAELWSHRYVIRNGRLNPNSRYRLRIEIDEMDGISQYFSEFSYPIITPEIDSVFWMRRGIGQPVTIHVATHSPDSQVLFYRWSFREDWETNSDFFHQDFPFRCWSYEYSRNILLGSAERTIFGRVIDIIHRIYPWDRRLSVLYRIDVTQKAISRRAHAYFENMRRNSQQTGSIFAPIPSELRGNIYCATDPNRYVIGYINVSTTTRKRLYIWGKDGVYESGPRCHVHTLDEVCRGMDPCNPLDLGFIGVVGGFVHISCVDCTRIGSATEQRPYDWPI